MSNLKNALICLAVSVALFAAFMVEGKKRDYFSNIKTNDNGVCNGIVNPDGTKTSGQCDEAAAAAGSPCGIWQDDACLKGTCFKTANGEIGCEKKRDMLLLGVLGVAVVFFGVALYFVVRHFMSRKK